MTTEIDVQVGRRVRIRRRQLEMTQKQLAKHLGVRFQQIQKYECAQNALSASRLYQVSRALDVPMGYFYEGIARTPDA